MVKLPIVTQKILLNALYNYKGENQFLVKLRMDVQVQKNKPETLAKIKMLLPPVYK